MDAAMKEAQERAEADARAAIDSSAAEAHNRGADVPVRSVPPRTSAPASAPVARDEWTAYTDDFIRRYELEPEQEQRARSFLRSAQFERDRYLQKKSDEIERVTQAAIDAAGDEERARTKEQADRLQAPIERMFQQLRDKLNMLPTRAQRARAEPVSRPARETNNAPTSAPAPAHNGD